MQWLIVTGNFYCTNRPASKEYSKSRTKQVNNKLNKRQERVIISTTPSATTNSTFQQLLLTMNRKKKITTKNWLLKDVYSW